MSLYSRVYQNLLMPLHGILRNRRYVSYRTLLERTQWWSRDQLLEFQWQELSRLLEHTFRSVPYYQEDCCPAAGTIGLLFSAPIAILDSLIGAGQVRPLGPTRREGDR